MLHPYIAARTLAAGACAFALFGAVAPSAAQTQTKLDASYTITVAHLPVGSVTVTVDIGEGDYTMSMRGRAGGMMRLVTNGDGTSTTHGLIKDGRLLPESYSSKSTSDDDTLDVKMVFEGGGVKELTASAPPSSEDRVALTDAHRKDILDPLSALLIPASEGDGGLGKTVCNRTLPIFDGRRRYDLKLAFKRLERVKAGKDYAGQAVVCAVTFQPIAGHRASSSMVKYLGDGREIEIAFAPVAGTRLLAPFRVSVANMLGNLVMQASRFQVVTRPSVPTSPTTGRSPE